MSSGSLLDGSQLYCRLCAILHLDWKDINWTIGKEISLLTHALSPFIVVKAVHTKAHDGFKVFHGSRIILVVGLLCVYCLNNTFWDLLSFQKVCSFPHQINLFAYVSLSSFSRALCALLQTLTGSLLLTSDRVHRILVGLFIFS